MGRLPRPKGDGLVYHAINRGNNRADVLGPDGEHEAFLGDLARTKERYPFALVGLLPDERPFPPAAQAGPGQSISRILQSLTVAHTWRYHSRHGTCGHVWQGRFQSPVDPGRRPPAGRPAVHRGQPAARRDGRRPERVPLVELRQHGGGQADTLLDPFPEWEQLGRTEPGRRARWRQSAAELDAVRASPPTLRRRGLGRGHLPSPRDPSRTSPP